MAPETVKTHDLKIRMCAVAYLAYETGALVRWLRLPAWKVGDRGFEPHTGLQVSKEEKCFFPAHS